MRRWALHARGEDVEERGPLEALHDVEIDDVDARVAVNRLEDGLVGGEMSEFYERGDVVEDLEGGMESLELKEHPVSFAEIIDGNRHRTFQEETYQPHTAVIVVLGAPFALLAACGSRRLNRLAARRRRRCNFFTFRQVLNQLPRHMLHPLGELPRRAIRARTTTTNNRNSHFTHTITIAMMMMMIP
nr:hypothetical protein TorRG33x02_239880 [Ipomoea trifida]